MDLHPAIETYFDADREGAREALTEAFTPDAAVADEGRTYRGRQAIGDWWTETKARYRTVLQPLDADQVDGATVVQAQVTGDFPGSPAVLKFAFRLDAHGITSLEIGA